MLLERSHGDKITNDLLAVVTRELGYREKAGQHTKFGAWYADLKNDSQYRNAPWCDMFIAWAADQAGVSEYVGEFAWTPSHARWFEQQGAWTDQPEPGALVFYDWSGGKDIKGIDHVGIVEKVQNGKIHTIEANVDRVWLKRKVRDESKVVGYGLPRKVRETLATTSNSTVDLRPGAVTAVANPGPGVDPAAAIATGVLTLALAASLVFTGVHVRRIALSTGRHRRRKPARAEMATQAATRTPIPATAVGADVSADLSSAPSRVPVGRR